MGASACDGRHELRHLRGARNTRHDLQKSSEPSALTQRERQRDKEYSDALSPDHLDKRHPVGSAELREAGLSVVALESAPDVGGTWYWNWYGAIINCCCIKKLCSNFLKQKSPKIALKNPRKYLRWVFLVSFLLYLSFTLLFSSYLLLISSCVHPHLHIPTASFP